MLGAPRGSGLHPGRGWGRARGPPEEAGRSCEGGPGPARQAGPLTAPGSQTPLNDVQTRARCQLRAPWPRPHRALAGRGPGRTRTFQRPPETTPAPTCSGNRFSNQPVMERGRLWAPCRILPKRSRLCVSRWLQKQTHWTEWLLVLPLHALNLGSERGRSCSALRTAGAPVKLWTLLFLM